MVNESILNLVVETITVGAQTKESMIVLWVILVAVLFLMAVVFYSLVRIALNGKLFGSTNGRSSK